MGVISHYHLKAPPQTVVSNPISPLLTVENSVYKSNDDVLVHHPVSSARERLSRQESSRNVRLYS